METVVEMFLAEMFFQGTAVPTPALTLATEFFGSLSSIDAASVLLPLADLADYVTRFISILWVALGLGLVIFFHELGHFAVAKWCDVKVERFSIGFGPIIWSTKRGETEYALSLVPFGGYVKMLGQDDMDASQLTSEEIAQDPRSYSAKSVPQRMAIISAGVIMNIITGLLFFALAFMGGVEQPAPLVGSVAPGMPAWSAGVRPGDELIAVNGKPVDSFMDLQREVALSTGDVTLTVRRAGGEEVTLTLTPDGSGSMRLVGISPSNSTTIIPDDQIEVPPVVEGTAASKSDPPLAGGDKILKVDDAEIGSFAALQQEFARKADQKVTLTIERSVDGSTKELQVTVPPLGFRTLGLRMDIGLIEAVIKDGVAAQAGIEIGDKIAKVIEPDGTELEIPKDLDPLFLPNYFASKSGEELTVVVRRKPPNSAEEVKEIKLTPTDAPGWTQTPSSLQTPLAVPSLGLAYPVQRNVVSVDEGSPADGKIKSSQRITKMILTRPDDVEHDNFEDKVATIELDDEHPNWANAFWTMQQVPLRTVALVVSDGDKEETIKLKPVRSDEHFLPVRGVVMLPATTILEADSFVDSLGMAYHHTVETAGSIYLTIRRLFGGELSAKNLHGPIGIANVAYKVAQQGISPLLLFLGFLSINLAVLNFLPIPVLDGGHMVFLAWEAITGKPPNERVIIILSYLGILFVLGLMLFVIYLDLFVHEMP